MKNALFLHLTTCILSNADLININKDENQILFICVYLQMSIVFNFIYEYLSLLKNLPLPL